METIVASLRGCFRQVPSVAIPAMLDCILASTTLSPACLFSALLNDFSDIIESITQRGETIDCEWHDGVASYVAALSHFLKNYDTCQMSIFIWKILFPLLKLFHASDHKLFSEVVDLFIGVITERNSWKVLESIFAPFLLRSIGLSMGSFQNDKFAIFKCSEKSNFKRLDDHELNQKSSDDFLNISTHKSTSEDLLVSQSYPLALSCTLLALTLDAAIRNKHKGVVSGSTTADILQIKLFVGNLLWDLSNLTLQMLTKSLEHRSTAIKFLLPCIFKAFVCDSTFSISVWGRDHVLTRKEYFAEIWKCCKLLFSLGPLERRDAYDILSLYLSFLSSGDEHGDVNVDGKGEAFDLSSDKKFWDEIKRGLLDKETLLRKLSIHILKATLNLSEERRCLSYLEEVSDEGVTDFHMMSKRGRWADMEARSMGVGRVCNSSELSSTSLQSWEAFIFLYEMLEEYGTHLVEAAWNHQILQLLQSSFSFNTAINCTDERLYHNWMLNSGKFFEWLVVLWERGFCHDNPQVRCLIMQSFLAIEWEKYVGCVRFVPQEFILGPLMQGLNDPIHHRDFGLKEIYSSRTIEATARLLRQYASYLEGRELICFLLDLASVLKKHSFGRAGLMSLAECIASAACGVLELNIHEIEQSIDGISDKFESSALFSIEVPNLDDQNDKSNLLEVFRFVIECSKKHFNPKYRHQVCAKILAATTTVMTALDVPLEMLLLFISSLPREYSDNGGSLRYILQKWLRGLDLQLLKSIGTFPENFISCQHPLDAPIAYDDGELEAWVSEARRWARVLFLVAREEHLYPILKFVQDCCGFAFKRNKSSGPVAVKFLILVSSLVLELQVIQERTSKFRVTTRNKGDSVSPMIGDNQCSYEESIKFEMFTPLLLTFLEKLVPFAEILCSSFCSAGAMEEVALPGSISGKLGGPSQRRLPTTLCTSVLEAVKSIETLAYVMRWCTQCKTDVLINSAHTFLWNFCWKVIRSPPSKSEVEAEVFLAAYEACAYALKDLVSVASPLLLDLVHESDNSFSSSRGRPLLDAFAITFIHNINNVIDGGHLARTRRAILMNYKWSCLESLLSLPRYALFSGVGSRMHNTYFSDTLVTQILGDLVDSLENAGEGSVLPMLRAIRLCMEHFASENMDILNFSSNIITVEMMWQLVHSSWILHISHNKRRVAPIAALLSSVLHHSVFGYEHMHELNNASGPLKWFVEKILEEGTKSPRTIRLAALHLSGLWLAYPFTLKYYMKELKLLTLYGSVAFDEDFEAELTENCEARNEVSVLSRSLDPELTEVFINTELYARVSVAVLFSKLAEMANLVEPTVKTQGDPPAIASGKIFLLELLDSVLNDKDLSKELYKKYSAIHRRKVRALQMICVLSRFVEPDIVEQVTAKLHTSLCRNNLPSVRQYLETLAIHIYLKFPVLVGRQLVPLLMSYDLRPQALSSYVFIAASIILHANKGNQLEHLDELLPPIIPLLTSHHHTLRGFAQVLVYQVLQKLSTESNSFSCARISLEERCFVILRSYLEHNPDCARLRASMGIYLDSFDPVKSISPAGIFTNRVEELEFECVPTTLMDRVIEFLNDTREDLRSSMAKDAASIKNESLHIGNGDDCPKTINSNGMQAAMQLENSILLDFQKKITFSKHELKDKVSFLSSETFYGPLSGIENEDQLLDQLLHSRGVIVEKLRASRQQIILVASLIDRIPNLAGLARTCEVFRAAGLAISDNNVLNDKQFQLISVTAEKWVPIVEVPEATIKTFLLKKKQEGFAVLGLEQTTNSIPLDHYNFPTKTVLVLGREKEGIPVEIIHVLDGCIEIPQLGVVRSLNVHVSGAIALWEYTRQQRRLLQ